MQIQSQKYTWMMGITINCLFSTVLHYIAILISYGEVEGGGEKSNTICHKHVMIRVLVYRGIEVNNSDAMIARQTGSSDAICACISISHLTIVSVARHTLRSDAIWTLDSVPVFQYLTSLLCQLQDIQGVAMLSVPVFQYFTSLLWV